ncbi:unnamed protein product [Adineta ricciae]|uniref:Uncharacterized protein n=1 Tax=Adineta ricciae TaxID=249248 RepID=A0A815W7F2_ADIRI|nr:unnamed protein product [Adineta ricciae]
MNVMKDYIGNDDDRTIFIIQCLNDKSIRSHSSFQNVNEIILLPGNYFQIITKCHAGNGLNMLLLKQQPSLPYGIFPLFLTTSLSLAENQLISENRNSLSFLSRRIIFEKWEKVGKTVAAGNGRGRELNQLDESRRIFIDKNQNIFIVDTQNSRIVQWKKDANKGIVVAGGNRDGNRIVH